MFRAKALRQEVRANVFVSVARRFIVFSILDCTGIEKKKQNRPNECAGPHSFCKFVSARYQSLESTQGSFAWVFYLLAIV